MAAAYDTYDYPAYWSERTYEHESEVICLKDFLNHIADTLKILEIGAGFGRLAPYYIYRAKKVSLTEPSAKLLSIARKKLSNYQNIDFIQSTLENLPHKFKRQKFDLVIMIRVLHHLTNLEKTFQILGSLVDNGGYLIIEFANKTHAKALLKSFFKGQFKSTIDLSSVDIRSQKSIKAKTLPFVNYHPGVIKNALKKYGFEIKEKRSVSNIRSPFLKKYIPISLLLWLESLLQKILSYLNFGPSIFILAKKVG